MPRCKGCNKIIPEKEEFCNKCLIKLEIVDEKQYEETLNNLKENGYFNKVKK